jgi:aminoglycoside phosphotransferase (APT) family kinase protein
MNTEAEVTELRDFLGSERGITATDIWLISRGYSSVYRVATIGSGDLAVLIHRSNKRVDELVAESHILKLLAHRGATGLTFPKPRNSCTRDEAAPADRFRGRLLSVYEWIEHDVYNGTPTSAGRAFGAYLTLQRRLTGIGRIDGLPTQALLAGTARTKRFRFADFLPLLPENSGWALLYRERLAQLEHVAVILGKRLEASENAIKSLHPSIIHYDPSPQNIGFDSETHPRCIFDFDQCKWGFAGYDVPWMLWSFAAHGLDLSVSGEREVFLKRLLTYYGNVGELGVEGEARLYWTFLLTRFCLTLHGRLEDTYERGFPNLRFMQEKLVALFVLCEALDDLDEIRS